ncbi:MAG: hypothetical protein EBZ49_00955 [Proteobacteria bacterium]|nr:hypothetical protein [Pseudomonadota bacterium]
MLGVRNTHMNIDYDEYCKSLVCLQSQIKKSGFEPDLIVGICRGGIIPAVSLSHALNIPLRAIHWSRRDWETKEYHPDIEDDIACGASKVLLVDEIIDSGITIQEIKRDWNAEDSENLKVACIVYNTNQHNVKPDFWYKSIDRSVDSSWVNFWWELNRGN